jgi:hypothetical protein
MYATFSRDEITKDQQVKILAGEASGYSLAYQCPDFIRLDRDSDEYPAHVRVYPDGTYFAYSHHKETEPCLHAS